MLTTCFGHCGPSSGHKNVYRGKLYTVAEICRSHNKVAYKTVSCVLTYPTASLIAYITTGMMHLNILSSTWSNACIPSTRTKLKFVQYLVCHKLNLVQNCQADGHNYSIMSSLHEIRETARKLVKVTYVRNLTFRGRVLGTALSSFGGKHNTATGSRQIVAGVVHYTTVSMHNCQFVINRSTYHPSLPSLIGWDMSLNNQNHVPNAAITPGQNCFTFLAMPLLALFKRFISQAVSTVCKSDPVTGPVLPRGWVEV